jgi:replicative superfamily II helicase
VLDRFGLFVFDEVQLLAEQGRGFTLESLLAFLHWRTQDTPHRLVLLSAALGNRGQLMSWLDPNGEGVLLSSSWRGPRRLHAVFTTTEVRSFR